MRFADLDAIARHAAVEFAELVRGKPETFHVALSGGSTPKRLFAELVSMGKGALPWDRVVLWWGDERCVPPDHPDSNYGMAKHALIDPLGLTRVHRMEGERPAEAAAADYERALVGALGAPPVFDLIWLGMGPDGHTASLFPGSPALAERQRFCVANPVDSPLTKGKTTRITLTYPALAAARAVRFLVAGADKKDALARIRGGADLPSGRVNGNVEWYVDAAAEGS
jgi:6-phosphogluconolactonase